MRWKTLFASFAFAALVLLSAASQANACSCVGPRPPCEEFGSASAVFVGTVLSVSTTSRKTSSDDEYPQRLISFSLEQVYKGVSGTEVKVITGMGGGDCGYGFVKGKRYLVYAYKGSESDTLGTGICSRTELFSNAKEDLQFLSGLAKAKPGGRIYGEVVHYSGNLHFEVSKKVSSMSGTTVIIEGQGQRLEVVTDRKGKYEITGLKPGEYKVSAQLPEQFGVIGPGATMDDKYGSFSGNKIEVGDRGCARADLDVRFDGRIGGVVRDSEKRPVPEMTIYLFRFESLGKSDERPEGVLAETDEEGRYEFRLVQPGRYIVGINVDRPPDQSTPYLRNIYPGVNNLAKAQVINIGEGTKQDGFDLTLSPRLTERNIKGVVLWSDGRPAVNASVSLDHEDAPGRLRMFLSVETNSRGEFSIVGLEGLKYSVHASVYQETPVFKVYEAEPVGVEVVENTAPVRLVIPIPASDKSSKPAQTVTRKP